MASTTYIPINGNTYTKIAENTEDFFFVNPLQTLLYVVYANTPPADDVSGFPLLPYQSWGREDAANITARQGVVWVKVANAFNTQLPVNK